LIVTASATAAIHRKTIIELAARYRLPSVYSIRTFIADGGLVSYRPEQIGRFGGRRAMSIVLYAAKTPLICRCRCQQNTKPCSTSKLPGTEM
jgi:hypothetical protein